MRTQLERDIDAHQTQVDADATFALNRDRMAADREAWMWTEAAARPASLLEEICVDLEYADLETLVKSVALMRSNDGLKQWHAQSIVVAVEKIVAKHVADEAFAYALANS